jgi:ABC-type Co2+ transport system permease subunit
MEREKNRWWVFLIAALSGFFVFFFISFFVFDGSFMNSVLGGFVAVTLGPVIAHFLESKLYKGKK